MVESASRGTPGVEHELVGRIFADRYEILAQIGEGGVGLVYKGRHIHMNRFVAIKVIRSDLCSNPTALQRFKQEAKAISALSHPNIVRVYDFGIEGDMPYLVMDLLEGTVLSDLLRSQGRMRPDRAIGLVKQCCQALAHAHEKGIVHRDLKASNIMICTPDDSDEEVVKIVDFGMAKLLFPELHGGDLVQELTQAGDVFGSPLYMSPEQCKGKPLDARSDIYSLGCVMYYCLVGDPPIVGQNLLDTLQKHINHEPSPCSDLIADNEYPAALDEVVLKALRKEPSERYQTMNEVLADIDNVISGNPNLLARRQSRPKVAKKVNHHAQVHFGVSVAVLLACVGMMAFISGRLFEEAVDDREQNMWVDHSQAGAKALKRGDLHAAERSYRSAVAEAQQFGSHDPRLASSLIALGSVYVSNHEDSQGESCLKRALDVLNKCYGPNCAEMYPAYTALAKAYQQQGKNSEAEDAQASAEALLGTNNHDRAVNYLTNYAALKRKQGDEAGARDIEVQIQGISRNRKLFKS